MYLNKTICFLCISFAALIPSAPGENIAAGKSYVLKPLPDHHRCKDRNGRQLTDGNAKGAYWSRTTTVGWNDAAYVAVQFDFQSIYEIDRVKIHTIGGGFANVNFPEFVFLAVSSDRETCHPVALASGAEWKHIKSRGSKGQPYTIVMDGFAARGRHVTLLLKAAYRHLFIDEIEVFGRPSESNKNESDGYPFYNNTDQQMIMAAQADRQLLRIYGARDALRQHDFAEHCELEQKLSAVQREIELGDFFDEVFLEEQKERVDQMLANLYHAYYQNDYVIVPVEPMIQPNEAEIVLEKPVESASVGMWQNEYEALCMNFINCSLQPVMLSISISPLAMDSGYILPTEDAIQTRRGIYVRALNTGYIADALVLFREQVTVSPGESLPVWFDINSKQLPGGKYKASMLFQVCSGVHVKASEERAGSASQTLSVVNLEIEVAEKRFPEVAALTNYCCNWLSPGSLVETRKDLDAHHVNVSSFASYDIPWQNAAGKFPLEEWDGHFEEVAGRVSHAKQLRLYLNFNSDDRDKGRFGRWLGPEWRKAFARWLQSLVVNLKDKGIGYEDFVLFPFDEQLGSDFLEVAKLIKKTDSNIRIYANSFGSGPGDFSRFREVIDIWGIEDVYCLRRPDWYRQLKSYGKEMWTYAAQGPGKSNDPCRYYRLLSWRAFQRGQTGIGLYQYYDGVNYKNLPVPWDDTLKPRGYYGVVYSGKNAPVETYGEAIVPSRRWQAWREGIEDYQYLYELQQAVDRLALVQPDVAKRIQEQLFGIVQKVVQSTEDKCVYSEARTVLADVLQQVTDVTNSLQLVPVD